MTAVLEKVQTAEEIISLMTACFGSGSAEIWQEKDLQSLLDIPETLAYLVIQRGHPLGYAIGRRSADECELISIGVLPKFRRQGMAHILLDKIIRDCADAGIQKLFLEVQENNEPAKRLYEKLDFEMIGQRKDYYKRQNGSFADALTMRLKISKRSFKHK